MAALEASPIPIELCPTSNMKTLRLSSLADHPTLRRWIEGGYPVSISTDDFGVFSTTASQRAQTSHRVPGRVAIIGSRRPSRLHVAGRLGSSAGPGLPGPRSAALEPLRGVPQRWPRRL